MNFCRYCGSKLESNAKFCTQCGNSTQPNNNVGNTSNNQYEPINYQKCPESETKEGGTGFITAAIIMFIVSYLFFFVHPMISIILRVGLIGVLVTGFITYPKNTGIKILFWGYVFVIVIDIILIILSIIACNNFVHSLQGCS